MNEILLFQEKILEINHVQACCEIIMMIRKEDNLEELSRLVACLHTEIDPTNQKILIELGLFGIIEGKLKEDINEQNTEDFENLWVNCLNLLVYFPHAMKNLKRNSIIEFFIKQLRKERYDLSRQTIIEKTLGKLFVFAIGNPRVYRPVLMLLLDFVSNPYISPEFQDIKNQVISMLSLKKLGFTIISKIPSIILYHLYDISDYYWNSYSIILSKSLRISTSCEDILLITKYIEEGKSQYILRLLQVIRRSLNSINPIVNIIKKFIWFRPGDYFSYTDSNSIIQSPQKFSISFWIYFKGKFSDSKILEMTGLSSNIFSISIRNNLICFQGLGRNIMFEFESLYRINLKSWNYISLSFNLKKNPGISMKVNENYIASCDIRGKLWPKVEFSSIVLGEEAKISSILQAKFASLIIFKMCMTEEEMNLVQARIYFADYNFITSSERSTEIGKLKENIAFLILPDTKPSELYTSDCTYYCKFSRYNGNNIIQALPNLMSLLPVDINNDILNEALHIFTVLFQLEDIKSMMSSNFIEILTLKLSEVKLNAEVVVNYIQMICSVCNPDLQKDFLFYFLTRDNIYSLLTAEANMTGIDHLVSVFQKLVLINENNIFWLAQLINSMKLDRKNITFIFRHFIQEFSSKPVITKIFSALAGAEDREISIIEGILDLIEYNSFEGEAENFLNIMLLLLKYPLQPHSYSSILKIIYQDLNKNLEKDMKVSEGKFDVLRYINERFTGITALISCLNHFGIKSKQYHSVLKHYLVDITLSKTIYIEDPSTFSKLLVFLADNREYFNSYIVSREVFPAWLCDLYAKSESLAIPLATYIFSNVRHYQSLAKLGKFMQKISNFSSSFDVLYDIFINLQEGSVFNENEILAEFICIFDLFNIKKVNQYRYCAILKDIVGIGIGINAFSVAPSIGKELSSTPTKHALRIVLNQIIRAGKHDQDLIDISLKTLLESTGYLKNFKAISLEEKKNLELIMSLYVFAEICERLYNKHNEFQDFFERFITAADILQKLTIFFENLSYEERKHCSDLIQSGTINSKSEKYLQPMYKAFPILTPDRASELLINLNTNQLFDTIFSQEWILNIHLILISLISSPLNQLKSPFPDQSKPQLTDSSLIYNINFESLLDTSALAKFSEQQSYYASYLETIRDLNQKNIRNLLLKAESLVEGKYFIKCRYDKYHRWSRIKYSERAFQIDPVALARLKESILRSEELTDSGSSLNPGGILSRISSKIHKSLQTFHTYLQAECEQIKISGSYFGHIRIGSNFFEFECRGKSKDPAKYFGSALSFTIKAKSCHYLWKTPEISEVLCRRFIHKNSAIEIFFRSGKSYFLNLFSKKSRTAVLAQMKLWKSVKVYSSISESIILNTSYKWNIGKISTLQYLLALNKYAGRSFHDLSQYPVFPWVVKDFESRVFDVSNIDAYRDFSYPIGAQTAAARVSLKSSLHTKGDVPEKYHHGQHYSNAGIVLYYMIRMEPYTTQAQILQGGRFDHPDRIFFSMQCSWNSGLLGSGDSKELIPELFYMPYVFENLNHCMMGVNYKFKIDSSEFLLPRWAMNSWDFVRKHRKYLESQHTSANIHLWIDLIFGYRQSGKSAEESCNLFHPVTYFDYYKGYLKCSNSEEADGIIDQVYHFGQTPLRIFAQPHAKRKFVPQESLFDTWTVNNRARVAAVYSRSGTFIALLAERNNLILVYSLKNQIKFTVFDDSDKGVSKVKDITLKYINTEEMRMQMFIVWKNRLVSSGYKDFSIKLHDFEGELYMSLSCNRPVTCLYSGRYLYSADYSVFAWNYQCKIRMKYFGHKHEVISISHSDEHLILASLSNAGILILHNRNTSEIILSLNDQGGSVVVSNLGVFLTVQEYGIRVFSFIGENLWEIQTEGTSKIKVSSFGDFAVFIKGKNHLGLCDIFERNITTQGVLEIQDVIISKSEKKIFCICQGAENIQLCMLSNSTQK